MLFFDTIIRSWSLLLILLVISFQSVSQVRSDTNQVKKFWKAGNFYKLKRGEYKKDLDSALYFFRQAAMLSDSLHAPEFKNESICRTGEVYLQTGNLEEAKKYFDPILEYYHSANKLKEAQTWMRMGYCTFRESSTYGYFYSFPITALTEGAPQEILRFFEAAATVFKEINHREGELEAARQIADIHLNIGKLDQADSEFLEVLNRYKSIGFKNLHYTYDLLSVTSRLQGNYDEALRYSMDAVRSAYATGDTTSLSHFYLCLAHTFHDLGQIEKSIEWYEKAFEKLKSQEFTPPNFYRVAGYLVRDYLETNSPSRALSFLLKTTSVIPPYSLLDNEIVSRSLGDCYYAIKQYELAEKYFLKMIEWDEKLNIGGISAEAYYIIGSFYINRKQFAKAGHYLKKILALPPGIATMTIIKDAHMQLYKVDSVAGHFQNAIQHFQQYISLKDSIFNLAKSRQVQELEIQYETAKKEQDIRLLQNEGLLQQNRLKQATQQKNLTFGGIILLLIIVSLLFNRYRLKQKNNEKLEAQQLEINQKNLSLQNLLNEKDNLLEEKEWLLKEVHHRVKNNLQIVTSLLSTQSAFLHSNEAVTAIRDSQHRIRAISLIHQKLYISHRVALVNMTAYIQELVDYLNDNFNTGRQIRFELDLATIELEVVQAVPVGLILNESITNAIKYAFPANRAGIITISLQVNNNNNNNLVLIITDNGIGLPENFNSFNNNSVGMSLMRGLTRQLGGSFSITGLNGVSIHIKFSRTGIMDETFSHE